MRRYLLPLLIGLLLGGLFLPVLRVDATGTLTIPTVFGSLPSGTANLSLFDVVFNRIRDYINAREITFGTLASRAVAGTAGRWYFATDTSQLFADTGSAWTQVGGAAVTGSYAIRGLVGANNTATPLTKWDMSADLVALRSPTDGGITVRTNTGTLTNDTALAGSVANGRDVAAVFTGNTWLHLYFIWNGTTLATLSSATAPPTGPALPTGYTAWAYAGFVRYGTGSGGSLLVSRWRGAEMFYVVATKITSNAASLTEQTISLASAVAPNATSAGLLVSAIDNAAGLPNLSLRVVSGSDYIRLVNASGLSMVSYMQLTIPNLSQQMFYLWDTAPSIGASISVTNLRMPNGGE